MTRMPPITLARKAYPRLKRRQNVWVSSPMTNAAIGQLYRYPAVGPTKTPSPPFPPDSTGAPTATTARNSSSARPPRRAPSTEPASITPSVCAVIGTGTSGTAIGGISPSTATMAAKRATYARSPVFTTSPPQAAGRARSSRRKVPEDSASSRGRGAGPVWSRPETGPGAAEARSGDQPDRPVDRHLAAADRLAGQQHLPLGQRHRCIGEVQQADQSTGTPERQAPVRGRQPPHVRAG